jgi:hypothetical protein
VIKRIAAGILLGCGWARNRERKSGIGPAGQQVKSIPHRRVQIRHSVVFDFRQAEYG